MADDSPARRRRVEPNVATKPKRTERRYKAHVSPGDTIEYGLTYEVQVERGLKVWLKAGATSTVLGDESSDDAWSRLKGFVDKRMEELIEEHSAAAT